MPGSSVVDKLYLRPKRRYEKNEHGCIGRRQVCPVHPYDLLDTMAREVCPERRYGRLITMAREVCPERRYGRLISRWRPEVCPVRR